MLIQSVFDDAFSRYGRVVEGYDTALLLKRLRENSPCPLDRTVYQPSSPLLEALPIFVELRNGFYGGMPIQIGYCNGSNRRLNCLEYHRDSEINVAADDIVLLLAPLQKLRGGRIDTAEVEAFRVPAGTMVQLYETTLHYAPCNAPGADSFRVVVVLPRNTNTAKTATNIYNNEDRLLWACNKWLVAHPDSDEAAQGAFQGLVGPNITIE